MKTLSRSSGDSKDYRHPEDGPLAGAPRRTDERHGKCVVLKEHQPPPVPRGFFRCT